MHYFSVIYRSYESPQAGWHYDILLWAILVDCERGCYLCSTSIVPFGVFTFSNPSLVSHYHPISLCNVIYKILAGHLRPHLDKLISPVQVGFVSNRFIQENTILVNEIVLFMKHKKGSMGWWLWNSIWRKHMTVLIGHSCWKCWTVSAFIPIGLIRLINASIRCIFLLYWMVAPLIFSNPREGFDKGIHSRPSSLSVQRCFLDFLTEKKKLIA